MGPADAAWFVAGIWVREGVAVFLVRAGVDEAGFSSAEERLVDRCADAVVEIPEDNEVGLRVALEELIDFFAEEARFFQADFRLIGFGGLAF